MTLQNYVQQFTNLHQNKSKRFGDAPHKPVLLLSIIELIAVGKITSNQMFLTGELIALFKDNWEILVSTEHTSKIVYPFFHLRGEEFWHLIPNVGFDDEVTEMTTITSFKALNEVVAYAEIDQELFLLCRNPESREILQFCLLDTYFYETKARYLAKKNFGESSYLKEIEDKVIIESKISYATMIPFKEQYIELTEEEKIVRGHIFKKKIPQIYNYTCCISGLRVQTAFNVQMVDACHIVPFGKSYDDTFTNGISLCPNLHRAFDRGLISIGDNYTVIVSSHFSESHTDYSIKKFSGKRILLPDDNFFYPKLENLHWHSKNIFWG